MERYLDFSGRDSRGEMVLEPFRLSQQLMHVEFNDLLRGEETQVELLKRGPTAAQLRHAYELGTIAKIKRRLNPNYELTQDEASGSIIYEDIRSHEFSGEYLQFINILGQPSNGHIPAEIINNPDTVKKCPDGLWLAEGGTRIGVSLPFANDRRTSNLVIPKRENSRLTWYTEGFPAAVTKNENSEYRSFVIKFLEQTLGKELPDDIKADVGWSEGATFDIVPDKAGNMKPGLKIVYRAYEWEWNNNPYALIIGDIDRIVRAYVNVREKT